MEKIINLTEEKMNKALIVLEERFGNIRVGRANPGLLEGLKVSYYGSDVPLNQLANISVLEARTLSIKPFDKSVLGNIEKAIFEADLGLTPNNNGETIMINFPMLTEERRKEYVKQVKSIAEESKISLRNARQEGNNEIKKLGISEDLEKSALEEIQTLINEYNDQIEKKLKVKETELMSL